MTSTRRRALACVALVALVATACGGSDRSGDTAAAPGGRDETAATAPSTITAGGDEPTAAEAPPPVPGTTDADPGATPATPAAPNAAAPGPTDAATRSPGPSTSGAPRNDTATAAAPPSATGEAKRSTPPNPRTAAAPPSPHAGKPAGPEVLRLGGVFPLSGPLGSVGTAMMQGVQAILSEVNESGGVTGSRLELLVEDDQFDPVRGKALIQKLITEAKVFAFAGIFSPFTIQAGLPDIRAAKVPVVSPSGSDDREFDEPLLYPVTNPCGRQMAGNVQHLVRDKKVKKLAVVYLNVEAVSNCTKQFTAVARKLGAEVVFQSGTAPAAPDCASRIVSARASGAEALIVIVDNLGVVKCVQAQKQQGWNVPVSISYNIVDDPTLLEGLGKAADGLLSSSPFSGASSPAFAEQCGAVNRFYPKAKVQFFLLVGCLGTKLLVEGLRTTGTGAGREALMAALDSGRIFSFGGLVPDLVYRPGGHLPYDLTATVEVRDGKWVRTGPLYTPEQP